MLIEVARQLFAKSGVDNTTMNDIALASGKGRRTVYTYFRSKHDIYWAVVESELNHILITLREVVRKDTPPEEKLMNYLYTRLETIKASVLRNGTLKAKFFRDIWKVEQARKNIDEQEVALIKGILEEGIRKGVFQMDNATAVATVLHYSLKGLDVPYIRGHFNDIGLNRDEIKKHIRDLLFIGIKK